MKNQNNYPPLCNTLLTGCSIGVVCLTPKRTEFGKQIRRRYGDNNLPMSRHKMTSLEPRNDGLTNTITTVTKDNYLLETYVENDSGAVSRLILTKGLLAEWPQQLRRLLELEEG